MAKLLWARDGTQWLKQTETVTWVNISPLIFSEVENHALNLFKMLLANDPLVSSLEEGYFF